MWCAAWPHVHGDLASTRIGAAAFLDNLDAVCGPQSRESWVAKWTSIGDAHCSLADLNAGEGVFDRAAEPWLCALTAFEVARRLIEEGDPRSGDVAAKAEAAIEKFSSLGPKVERVQIASFEEAEFSAYYLPAGGPELFAPAVICISEADETAEALLARLLPVVIGRGMSVLAVSHDDISSHWGRQSDILLSCCLDYLSARPDVDATRIAVYGEGVSAVLATDFASSDRRVAAAVCDGGLWNWTRTLASVGWMTMVSGGVDEAVVSTRRSRLMRQLKCPVLVVAGGRGPASISEAMKLQSDCAAARMDLEVIIPRISLTRVGEIENFVASDDCIFEWLERKLAGLAPRPLSTKKAGKPRRQR
ncbi:alpha/beta hydrolase [Bradyrhizobium sp. 174]|uniref:alpha/beta hydrolase family protein n=1 Tax=Bradyrhizobium sp. 174 TaxID=2782645 RepID=UPI001FF83D7E|nr:alpha/beta hydrolase [Bradyrhizobium sp. 174]MCK1571213.1 alpha/beta hydrolase [Bradyrhizobium sp. 174]